jgi:hypothetical protein
VRHRTRIARIEQGRQASGLRVTGKTIEDIESKSHSVADCP